MNYLIYGKNLKITQAIKEHIYSEFEKIEKFLEEDTKVNISLTANKNYHKVEVTIFHKGRVIRAEQKTDDLYLSISKASSVIEKQIKKFKSKIVNKKQSLSIKKPLEEDLKDEEKINIIRHKRFNIKPMSVEEACIQMDLLGHNFFMFLDDETYVYNVVYKRKNNTYGQITPS